MLSLPLVFVMACDKVVSLLALPNTSSVKIVSRGVLLDSHSTTIEAGKSHVSTSQSLGLLHSPSLNNAIFRAKKCRPESCIMSAYVF